MRFDGIGQVPDVQSPERTDPSGSSSHKGGESRTKAITDQTQLSASQSRVQDLKAQLTGLADVRQERVAALQKAVADGSFHVTDQQVADAILGHFFGPVAAGKQ